MHVALAVSLPLFGWAAWWQLHRALAGNGLSWAYTFEWPFFGLYAVVTWWRLVHDVAADRIAKTPGDDGDDAAAASGAAAASTGRDAGNGRGRGRRRAGAPAAAGDVPAVGGDAGAGDELEAYNAYLASLASRDGRRRR